jgi:hypothetical protein
MYKGKIGIAIISFDRPLYFAQTIASIEQQEDLDNYDFHLFQDGQVNKFSGRIVTDKTLINKNIRIFEKARLPNKTAHIEEKNIGNANNQFNAAEFMSANYEYFMVIEDDVILSPDYFRLIRIMIDQYLGETRVFSVSLSFERFCKPNDIDKFLDKVVLRNVHWWAECWKSKNWFKVRGFFLEYMKLVKDVDYHDRPAYEIKKMFRFNGFNIPQTSQDAGKDFALFKSKMKRITSVVNRGFYIGEHGMHFRTPTYLKYGYANMKPFAFESDKLLNSFTLI